MKDKVFVIGLEKTGTTTTETILNKLGYVIAGWNPEMMQLSKSGKIGKLINAFDSSIANAAQDYPWAFHFKDFDKKYENAKFILTTRSSPETWYKSILYYDMKEWWKGKRPWLIFTNRYFGDSATPVNHSYKWKDKYNQHNKAVRDYFQGRDDFIEICYEEGDSAEDICGFLGFNKNIKTPQKRKQSYENFDKLYSRWLKELKESELRTVQRLGDKLVVVEPQDKLVSMERGKNKRKLIFLG